MPFPVNWLIKPTFFKKFLICIRFIISISEILSWWVTEHGNNLNLYLKLETEKKKHFIWPNENKPWRSPSAFITFKLLMLAKAFIRIGQEELAKLQSVPVTLNHYWHATVMWQIIGYAIGIMWFHLIDRKTTSFRRCKQFARVPASVPVPASDNVVTGRIIKYLIHLRQYDWQRWWWKAGG